MTIGSQILLVLLCLLGTSFFAGMETGVISINRLRLQHLRRHKVRGAEVLHGFLERPDHLLGTTLVGTNVCTVMASVMGASIATHLLGSWGHALSSVIMTVILLVFCEYLPKSWFQSSPAYRTLPFAYVLRAAGFVFYPIGRVITGIANLLIPVSIRKGPRLQMTLTREELQYLTREGEQTGTLSADERRMIHGVFELTQKTCGDIMRPISDVTLISSDTRRTDILKLAYAREVTRLPVYQGAQSHIVGIVHVLDLASDEGSAEKTALTYMRPPQFVPCTMPVDEVLPRMRLSRQPMALVVDDQRRVLGLLTIEDVLREIVGEM